MSLVPFTLCLHGWLTMIHVWTTTPCVHIEKGCHVTTAVEFSSMSCNNFVCFHVREKRVGRKGETVPVVVVVQSNKAVVVFNPSPRTGTKMQTGDTIPICQKGIPVFYSFFAITALYSSYQNRKYNYFTTLITSLSDNTICFSWSVDLKFWQSKTFINAK